MYQGNIAEGSLLQGDSEDGAMFFDNAELDTLMEFAEAATIIPDDDAELTDTLKGKKVEAAISCAKKAQWYREKRIRNDLVHIIFEKRMEMIRRAQTVGEIKEIMEGTKPTFDGGKYITSKYGIPEEELVIWMIIATNHAPPYKVSMRIIELVQQVFGIDVLAPGADLSKASSSLRYDDAKQIAANHCNHDGDRK